MLITPTGRNCKCFMQTLTSYWQFIAKQKQHLSINKSVGEHRKHLAASQKGVCASRSGELGRRKLGLFLSVFSPCVTEIEGYRPRQAYHLIHRFDPPRPQFHILSCCAAFAKTSSPLQFVDPPKTLLFSAEAFGPF